MIDAIKSWITGVCVISLFLSILFAIAPEGGPKKMLKLISSIVLIIAIFNPIIKFDDEKLSWSISQYTAKVKDYESKYIYENMKYIEDVIQDKTASYILDKINALGFSASIEVICEKSDEGFPYPYYVIIKEFNGGEDNKKNIIKFIENELAVPLERQEWI